MGDAQKHNTRIFEHNVSDPIEGRFASSRNPWLIRHRLLSYDRSISNCVLVIIENKLLASHELQVNILELIQAFLVMRNTSILNFAYFT